MNKMMKKELINDVLTGLLVAAAFAAVVPVDALAQNLAAVGSSAQKNVALPFVQFVSYISYGLGTVMTVAGIANAKKHADNPSSNPLGPALGKLGAGAAFLAAPSVAGMLMNTATTTGISGNATYGQIGSGL